MWAKGGALLKRRGAPESSQTRAPLILRVDMQGAEPGGWCSHPLLLLLGSGWERPDAFLVEMNCQFVFAKSVSESLTPVFTKLLLSLSCPQDTDKLPRLAFADLVIPAPP